MKYYIIGAARSGLAAAKLAVKTGNKVFISESATASKHKDTITELEKLKKIGCEYEFGGNSVSKLETCDCVIVSPGVPPSAPILKQANLLKIPIISELEFAARQISNPIVAITGTNGKTTTTTLVQYILHKSGKKSVVAGNIGNPLSNFVGKISSDVHLVVEVSSYQLEYIDKFRPNIAIILNITPDHLSYHGSMDNYIKSKFNIFKNQIEQDFLIFNSDDNTLSQYSTQIKNNIKSQILNISLSPVNWGVYINSKEEIVLKTQQKEEELMQVKKLALPGIHNQYNSMAAAITAKIWQISNEDIRDSLMSFQGVEHRLEFVHSIRGVDYINDSKATNINAAWYALSSYQNPIIWIAGGLGDNNNYHQLDKLVDKKVKTIITIGEEEENIFAHYSGSKSCHKAGNVEKAVKIASEISEQGDVVLFSPACKSFDQFLNFEHRGEVFKREVLKLLFFKN